MVQERPTTPEKQLLKLIEDPSAQGKNQRKIKRLPLSLFSFSALRGRFSFLKAALRQSFSLKRTSPDVNTINKVLRIIIFLLVVGLGGNIAYSIYTLKEIPDFILESAKTPSDVKKEEISLKPAVYYLEKPRTRDLFKFGSDSVASVKEEVKPPQEKEDKLIDKLKLVGIGWSDDPDVMIENTETNKLYFLKRGDAIDGVIKIEAIFQKKVILSVDGEEVELK